MTDRIAANFASRRIDEQTESLRLDVARLAEEASRYAARLAQDPAAVMTGGANRLLQSAAQLAQAEARLLGARETAAYLSPTED